MIFYVFLFVIAGLTYQVTEMLWAGKTHLTMFFAAGMSVCLLALADGAFITSVPDFILAGVGCGIITVTELLFGLVFNRGLHMNIWDYSGKKFNFLGQICLKNSFYWFVLSFPALWVSRALRPLLVL